MTELETIAYLEQRGVKPLGEWVPGQAVLYVLEEKTRQRKDAFDGITPEKIPSIVRVDSPKSLDLKKPHNNTPFDDVAYYYLENDHGRVDYYAIDPVDGPVIVKSSNKRKAYSVRKGFLFAADDELFPPGNGAFS